MSKRTVFVCDNCQDEFSPPDSMLHMQHSDVQRASCWRVHLSIGSGSVDLCGACRLLLVAVFSSDLRARFNLSESEDRNLLGLNEAPPKKGPRR